MGMYTQPYRSDELYHYGVMGMKWGVRRYQNPDGTLTEKGKKKYSKIAKNKRYPDSIGNAVALGAITGGAQFVAPIYAQKAIYKKPIREINKSEMVSAGKRAVAFMLLNGGLGLIQYKRKKDAKRYIAENEALERKLGRQ